MKCSDCGVEAASKYREACPRCGGELRASIVVLGDNIHITVGGVEIKGWTEDVFISADYDCGESHIAALEAALKALQ